MSLESISGEAEFVQSRGKRKLGYELSLSVTCQSEDKIEQVEISDLCDDLSDP